MKELLLQGDANIPAINFVFDVYTDMIVEEVGSAEVALLWVLLQDDITEFSVCSNLHVLQLNKPTACMLCTASDKQIHFSPAPYFSPST